MTKGEGIGSQTRVWYDGSCGMEEERGEVNMYMVLSSYYYNMLVINGTT